MIKPGGLLLGNILAGPLCQLSAGGGWVFPAPDRECQTRDGYRDGYSVSHRDLLPERGAPRELHAVIHFVRRFLLPPTGRLIAGCDRKGSGSRCEVPGTGEGDYLNLT